MKKQGFTLLELLAVIVILAIIALITTPIVLKMIENSKKGAAESDAYAYVKATETAAAAYMLDKHDASLQGQYTIQENGNLLGDNGITLEPKLKGTKPSEGIIILTEKGVVDLSSISEIKINGYFVSYNEKTKKLKADSKTSGQEYKETILNGTDPIISGNLVPVKIENDGKVTKANTKSSWYNYANKRWANAVILVDKTKSYDNGDIIPESNIQSYFVWIPRYKYKLFNTGNISVTNSKPTISIAKTIEIVFDNKETTQSKGTSDGAWLTHPAFTSFNTNGMWVGKFETTGTTSGITVKPNISSLRNQTVGTFFNLGYNYNRSLDSHMMKNTEWGAVAYLSHSKYGINKEVNINNNSSFITGYSSADGVDQSSYPGTYGTASNITQPYNTTTGYKASTTGNITGIYDMSGGATEYMASYISGKLGSSGLTPSNYNSKYFDVYSSTSTITSYKNRILGDATGELGLFYNYADKDGTSRYHNGWYADNSCFVDSSYPWFSRGGYCGEGVLAGQFNFSRYTGGSNDYFGFRLVLAD